MWPATPDRVRRVWSPPYRPVCLHLSISVIVFIEVYRVKQALAAMSPGDTGTAVGIGSLYLMVLLAFGFLCVFFTLGYLGIARSSVFDSHPCSDVGTVAGALVLVGMAALAISPSWLAVGVILLGAGLSLGGLLWGLYVLDKRQYG